MPYDYRTIKDLAQQNGLKVTDLIALAPQNDPFYTGTPGDLAMGEWFAGLYSKLGYERNWRWNSQKVHIRRFHYALVSQKPAVLMPSGAVYENTMQCWDYVLMASKVARYLGLVPPASFEDKKNPEAKVFSSTRYEATPTAQVYGTLWTSDTSLPDFPELPYYSTDGFYTDQRYLVEVWCEKTTVDDIVIPLCERYGANYQTGAGELSITATLKLAERVKQAGKPTRIFYVSDFDPAGRSMPVAIARKLEFFVRQLGLDDLDIRLFPVVLTEEQVAQYSLPRIPIKDTERRKEHFELQHGQGATELDALEALFPGVLTRILTRYIRAYYDETLLDRVRDIEQDYKAELDQVRKDVLTNHQVDIDKLKKTYDQIRQEFEARMSGYATQLQEIWQRISQDLGSRMPDADAYTLPEPDEAEEVGDGLYNSTRDYEEQIAVYKQFQGKV